MTHNSLEKSFRRKNVPDIWPMQVPFNHNKKVERCVTTFLDGRFWRYLIPKSSLFSNFWGPESAFFRSKTFLASNWLFLGVSYFPVPDFEIWSRFGGEIEEKPDPTDQIGFYVTVLGCCSFTLNPSSHSDIKELCPFFHWRSVGTLHQQVHA